MKRAVCFIASCLSLIVSNALAQEQHRSQSWIEAIKHIRELRQNEVARISRIREKLQANPQPKQQVDEQHLDLNLRIDPQQRTIEGTVTLRFVATANLGKLKLRLAQSMEISGAQLDQKPIAVQRAAADVTMKFVPALTPGSTHTLSVSYRGLPLTSSNGGMLFDTHAGTASATTLSEPFGCSNWWPCIDDLSDKLTADITLTVPPGMVGASNGRFLGKSTGNDEWIMYRWRESYPIANYLLSANVTNYASFSSTYRSLDRKRKMPVRYFVYPEDVQQAQINFQRIPDMIHTFATMIGEYPFLKEKYGMIAYGWGPSMEHQTLTSVKDDSTALSGNFDVLFAHELAHQWFGDDVTCASWDDIWLNEGFATYFEIQWGIRMTGEAEGAYMAQFYDDGVYNGALGGSVHLASDANPFGNIGAIYDKGGWVLHMLKYVMGTKKFLRALRNYATAHAYSNASTTDFRLACESVYGKPLDWFFDQWVYTPFRPIYSVSFQQNAGSFRVTIRQSQPHQIVNRSSNADVYIMPVQLTAHFNDGTVQVFNVWNDHRQQTFTLNVSKTVTSVTLDDADRILKVVQ